MKKLNSLDFFYAWIETVKERKDILLDLWQKPNLYTSYIKGDDNCLLYELASKLDLHCYPFDYYSIDAVFYREEDRTPSINADNFWLREIRIAFEHENYFRSGLFQEVSHLLTTNCELRVLVTYPNNETKEELEFLHKIISGTSSSKLIADEKSFLIIFGYQNGFQWEGFTYTEEKWEQIQINE